MSPAIAAGCVIAIVPDCIGVGHDGGVSFDVTDIPAVNFSDAPLQIVDGSGTVAAPVYSVWQNDLLLMKLRLRAAWGVCQPGAVQYMTGVNW